MKQNRKPLSVNLVKKHPLQLLMVALFAVCMIFVPKFATMGNLVNMLIQVSFNAIFATGATYVILVGDTDLSSGAVGGLAGMMVSYLVLNMPEISKLGGISVMKTKVIAHVIASSLAAFTGCLYASKLLSGQPQACDGYELTAMASVAIGGTSMRGGVSNTILGIIVFGMLNNSMNLLGISSYWQMVITGIIIAVSVIADGILNKE